MRKENEMKKMRLFADATKTGLPFILIPMNESAGLIMLIDTGSDENVMFGYAYNELKEIMKEKEGEEETKRYLYGIDGKPCLVNIAYGDFSICGRTYHMNFLIREADEAGNQLSKLMGFPICGMIGTKFMAEHGWVLDFANQEILIPDVMNEGKES